jgi:hypothetical protein
MTSTVTILRLPRAQILASSIDEEFFPADGFGRKLAVGREVVGKQIFAQGEK